MPDWQSAAKLVKAIAENYKLPYYTLSPTYSICKNHGYIPGEEYSCPQCQGKTEVYSRITGYYRPLQNWNEGKMQEFDDRKEYDIDIDNLKKIESNYVRISKDNVHIIKSDKVKYLFITKKCPSCKVVKEMLKDEAYELIDAEENLDLVNQYGIMQAPTLVVTDGENSDKYVNASNIRKYLTETCDR